MHTIRDTPKNPSGLCALSVDNDNGFIAYPGSSQVSYSSCCGGSPCSSGKGETKIALKVIHTVYIPGDH